MNQKLKETSLEIRRKIVKTIASLGSGHIGGSLSIADVLTVLYFDKMNIDPKNPKMEGRDRLIVSKGHSGPGVYSALAQRGYFPEEELLTLNKIGTNLPSHCDMNLTIGVDMTTGSLGQGFSAAVGVAVGSQIKKDGATIYTIIGDGESQEGQIWEAALFAPQRKLGNLIAFTDNNGMQIDGNTDDIVSLGDIKAKWEAFGWDTVQIDGHDFEAISNAIDNAKKVKDKPSMIILDTIKGKGVSFVIEAGFANHSMPVSADDLEKALKELV